MTSLAFFFFPDGLVLEVARSAVGHGRGLFIRLNEGVDNVTLSESSVLCGFAEGSLSSNLRGSQDKSVIFHLGSLDSQVFYQDRLLTVEEVLDELGEDVTLHGHVLPGHEKPESIDEKVKNIWLKPIFSPDIRSSCSAED